jgi:hypothetical protein
MPQQSLFNQLYQGVASAVTDVREKLVEEPMWGRSLSEPGGEGPQWPEAKEPQRSVGSATHVIDIGPTQDQMGGNGNYRLAAMERELSGPQWPQSQDQEQGRDRDERDHGMER